MREYTVNENTVNELSIPLLSFLGKKATEECTKLKNQKNYPSFPPLIYFKFFDGYERFTETSIEKFIEECTLKKIVR